MRVRALVRVWAALAVAWLPWSCGTDAVGVSQCRTIEAARCRAGVACRLVDDLDACLRYTRDHCLHGTDTGGTPKRAQVSRCEGVIEAAGECAQDSRRMSAATCGIDLVNGTSGATVCDVVTEPERAQLCSFLAPDEAPPAPVHHVDAGADSGN